MVPSGEMRELLTRARRSVEEAEQQLTPQNPVVTLKTEGTFFWDS